MTDVLHPSKGFLITDEKSRVLFTTPDVEERYGFAVPEVIGRRPAELWGGRMGKEFYEKFWHGIAHLHKPHSGRVFNHRKDGGSTETDLNVAPLLDEKGEPKYFIEAHSGDAPVEFVSSFQTAFQSAGNPVLQAAFLQAYLGCPVDPAQIRTREDLLKALHEQCIAPLAERFRRREDDRELIELAQKNPDAFSRLYDRYAVAVRRFFAARLKAGPDTVEDLTQEVFLRAYRALPFYRPGNASYLTYLSRIAHNLLVNHYRSTHVSIAINEDEDTARHDALDLSGLFDLSHAVSLLPATEQAVLKRFYESGLSVRDIAVELGRSENAVKLILSRSRRKLRGYLE